MVYCYGMQLRTLVAFFLVGFFLLHPVVFAQQSTIDLSIEMIPGTPSAGQSVVLVAKSYGVNLNESPVSWTYGGRTIASGVGKTRISVIAPENGAVATATVTVSAAGFETTSASITLNPGSIDMLWEAADAYVPPFYKGKAMLAPGGIFRVTAIPSGTNPNQSVFTWTRNDSVIESSSGYGKSSITLQHTIFNEREKIIVDTPSGAAKGTGIITLTPRSPWLVAYQKKDGYIDYANGTLNQIRIKGAGSIVRFEPYFFSVASSILRDLSFEIKNNDEQVYGDDAVNEIAITHPEKTGESTLSVGVAPIEYGLQNLKRNFTVIFE